MKKVINIILILVIVIAFGRILYKGYQYYTDEREYSKIQALNPMITKNIETKEVRTGINNEEKYKNNAKDLLDINNNYKLWLSISNSNINYPVVQGIDNEFYLDHSFEKEKNISGTLFIDYKNNIDSDKNIVIYGHHMKNETMFHNLNFFKEEEFFYNNKITIIKDEKEYKYDVFSVYVIPENEAIFNMSFRNDTEYLNYIDTLINKSYFNKKVKINTNKEIITLVTCSYEYDGARTVIHGIN